jgi:putative beta-lysine N-acetyltransferase
MTVHDTIRHLGRSLIQHGHFNDRIYVMRLFPEDVPAIIPALDELAGLEGYSKIFVKVPGSLRRIFRSAGYTAEATIPFFFNGGEPAAFMAKYLDPGRRRMSRPSLISRVITACTSPGPEQVLPPLPEGIRIRRGEHPDADSLAAFYRGVFESYPFPIFDPEYIRRSMEGNVRYFLALDGNTILAASSCELDPDSRSVEMTDFATSPAFRGRRMASHLLRAMEEEAGKEGMAIAYTIARAVSYPINAVFSRAGYTFCGTLVNNTNICGSLESMNVWYRRL